MRTGGAMTLTEALQILYAHQIWRRGGDAPATDPKKLTTAIEIILRDVPNLMADAEDHG